MNATIWNEIKWSVNNETIKVTQQRHLLQELIKSRNEEIPPLPHGLEIKVKAEQPRR